MRRAANSARDCDSTGDGFSRCHWLRRVECARPVTPTIIYHCCICVCIYSPARVESYIYISVCVCVYGGWMMTSVGFSLNGFFFLHIFICRWEMSFCEKETDWLEVVVWRWLCIIMFENFVIIFSSSNAKKNRIVWSIDWINFWLTAKAFYKVRPFIAAAARLKTRFERTKPIGWSVYEPVYIHIYIHVVGKHFKVPLCYSQSIMWVTA